MKLLLFDLDGTILHAKHTPGREPFPCTVAETFGVAVDWNGMRPDGKTDPVIIAELLARAGAATECGGDTLRAFEDRLAACFADALATGATRVEAIPGVRALLEDLAVDARFALGVLTGNLARAAELKLQAAGLDAFFTVGAFGSDHATRAALPDVARARYRARTDVALAAADCVIVGDTPLDHAAAAANGMPCVLVATGRTPLADLERLRPAAVLPDWRDTARARRVFEAL